MSHQPVEIVRRCDDGLVKAQLYDNMRPEDLVLVERDWTPVRLKLLEDLLGRGVSRSEWPQSLHWDWSSKAAELKLLEATGFGIACNKSWEGVMLTKTASHFARLPEDKGSALVYIDYLETAPWNWRVSQLGQWGRYKAVGSVLFNAAVQQSEDEGFHGRIGLHALPQAVTFYDNVCVMTCMGPDSEKQDLLYFEYTREQAQRFLNDGGAK